MGRIFSSLLDRRIKNVIHQTVKQKGFTKENGCYANIRLLSAVIREAKESGGTIMILDISKTFDTVPHGAIKGALERKGLSPIVVNYLTNMYAECQTSIHTKDGKLEIELKRGVKQGDPLSPTLFNLVIEPLIEVVQEKFQGINVEGHNLSVMAFADDLVILAKNKDEAINQAEMIYNNLRALGMSLSIEKSLAFQYVSRNKTWYIRDPELMVKGIPIPYGEPNATFKYLGAWATPWKGLTEGREVIKTVQEMMNRIRALPLKPLQKVTLLRTYILPKFTYGLVMNPSAKEVLKEIDSAIRNGVRKYLHLHDTTSSAFLYTPTRMGGLGLIETLPMVMLAALRNAIKAASSADSVVRDILSNERSQKNCKAYADALQLLWPVTIEELNRKKEKIKKGYKTEWAKQPAQGQGVEDFAGTPIANAWLNKRNLIHPSRIPDAIRLRTNTYPTRATIKRAHKEQDPTCRTCGETEETLGHILGQCRSTKDKRINRHNEIVRLIQKRLAKNNIVMIEPTIQVNGDRYKPDLVIKNETRVLVLDVTVRYENGNYLAEAAKEKANKYEGVADKLKQDLGMREAMVIPIVIGSRGAIPKSTAKRLKEIEIPKSDWLTISLIALRSSIEIINSFMDH